jgi:uncharacterized phage infection (PIP) family protein YhgE
VRAKQLLKAHGLWTVPVVVGSVLLVLITAFYIGSVVNPVGHLLGLPVSLVNEDAGATIGSRHVDLGDQLRSGVIGSHVVSRLLAITPERLPAAEDRMNHNGAYATVVIPPTFTASLLSLTGVRLPPGASAGRPTVELLNNQRAGTVGVGLASGVIEHAIARASEVIGRQLLAVGLLGMDAPNAGDLWLFTWLCAASVAAGTLVLFAALGSQGQLLALLLFVYLGLASAGGTVPIQALPGPLKLVSQIEPLRQILAGTRSILYFNAAGNAGLTRGLIAATAGLILWLALGAIVVRWYDRKGLHRVQPDLLAYVQQSISAYRAQEQPQHPGPAQAGQAPEA